MKTEALIKCDECGGADEVLEITEFWSAWGRNCFDFNWEKIKTTLMLCADCESSQYVSCEECGVFIRAEYWGIGAASEDRDHDLLCPDCAQMMDLKFPMAQRLLNYLNDNWIDKRWVAMSGNWHPWRIP